MEVAQGKKKTVGTALGFLALVVAMATAALWFRQINSLRSAT